MYRAGAGARRGCRHAAGMAPDSKFAWRQLHCPRRHTIIVLRKLFIEQQSAIYFSIPLGRSRRYSFRCAIDCLRPNGVSCWRKIF